MLEMNPWFGRLAVFASLLVFVLIRWPHGMRHKAINVVERRAGRLEVALLVGAVVGTTLIPLLWIVSPLFAFAEYPLYAAPFAIGMALMLFGLWLFYRSHTDLGLNWSVTLEMREGHTLITDGIYAKIRHPMYSAMFVLGVAQTFFCQNWFVGPAYLVTFGLLYLLRVRVEERMMVDRFGSEYEAYMKTTGRVMPRLW